MHLFLKHPFKRYMGFCNSFQIKMTNCINNQLKRRRELGAENVKKRELEEYAKKNPAFAEKLKLLEDLKAKQEQGK